MHAIGKKSPSDEILYRDFVQKVSWECAGLAADAWNAKHALEAARADKSKIFQRIQRHIDDADVQQREAKEAELRKLADGTRAAKDELAALRKLALAGSTAKKVHASGANTSKRSSKAPDHARSNHVHACATAEDATAADSNGGGGEKVSLPPLGRSSGVSSSGRSTPVGSGNGASVGMGSGGLAAARQLARQHLQDCDLHTSASSLSSSRASSRCESR